MKLLRSVGIVLAALAGAALPGCSGSSKTQVGFVSNNPEEFWSIADVGARKAAQELDVDIIFQRPSGGTAAEQKEIIDTMLNRGVKAVAVSVIDPPNQRDFLNSVAKRVPLIAVDNDAPDTDRLCYLGTDNYVAGKAAGQLVKEALPDGGTIAIFVGQVEPINARERRKGVLDELAGAKDATGETYGKYTLVGQGQAYGPFTDDVDRKRAKENADNVLAQLQGKENVCLIGLWAYNAPAIYSAVQAKNLEGKIKIVGFDEDRNTLEGIKRGHIYGTVVQQPYEFGYQSVKMMAALAKGDRSVLPKGGLLPIPHLVIKQDNVVEFEKKLNGLLGK